MGINNINPKIEEFIGYGTENNEIGEYDEDTQGKDDIIEQKLKNLENEVKELKQKLHEMKQEISRVKVSATIGMNCDVRKVFR